MTGGDPVKYAGYGTIDGPLWRLWVLWPCVRMRAFQMKHLT